MECIFCKIANHQTMTPLLYSGYEVVAFEPLNPVAPGHILVVPRLHVSDFSENPVVTAATMQVSAQLGQNMKSCNLITSKGWEATQSVFHLHVHLVPRRYGDGLHLPWTGQEI